jgi:hypothetical protein
LHLIGNAFAVVALRGLLNRIHPGFPVFGLDAPRKAAAVCNVGGVGHTKHCRGITAPQQGIAVEPPFVSGIADRTEDLGNVWDIRRLLNSGHARPVLETPRRVGRWP